MSTAAISADFELGRLDWPADLMTATQVAQTVQLTAKTVRTHIRRGQLRAVRFGTRGGYRIRAEDAQAWVAQHLVVAAESESIDALVARRRRSALAGAPPALARPR